MIRDAKGLSQEYMAEQLGISKNAYGKIERGQTKPHLHRLEQIAVALELSLEELLNGQVVIYSSQNGNNFNFQTIAQNNQEIAFLQQEIAHLKERNAWLERENTLQRQLLAQYEAKV